MSDEDLNLFFKCNPKAFGPLKLFVVEVANFCSLVFKRRSAH